MPRFLVSYDLATDEADPHSAMIEAAEQVGWSTNILDDASQLLVNLPNTTLYGEFTGMAAAQSAFLEARTQASQNVRAPVTVTSHVLVEIIQTSADEEPRGGGLLSSMGRTRGGFGGLGSGR